MRKIGSDSGQGEVVCCKIRVGGCQIKGCIKSKKESLAGYAASIYILTKVNQLIQANGITLFLPN
jgi:hypothetical protein